MRASRLLTGLSASGAVLATLLGGCDTSALVASYPGLSPYIGPRPKASPFALGRGHISGKVVQNTNQPVGDAFVTTGGAYTFSAKFPDGFKADEDTVPDRDDDKDRIFVLHDFEEGKGDEPALRIKRKFPSGTSRDGKYWYLRAGEFLLEGLPEGEALITARFGDVTSASTRQTIFSNFMLTGVEFRLPIPEALGKDAQGLDPKILDWADMFPKNGITVKIVTTKSTSNNGDEDEKKTVNYNPDPPDVRVILRAPPGSGGADIYYYQVVYEVNTIGGKNIKTNPIIVPTPPIRVPPGQQQNFGPSQEFDLPIGSEAVQKLYSPQNAADVPALIVAKIQFLDDSKKAFLDASGLPLEVAVPLRSLAS